MDARVIYGRLFQTSRAGVYLPTQLRVKPALSRCNLSPGTSSAAAHSLIFCSLLAIAHLPVTRWGGRNVSRS